jgi:hypothetical protein
VPLAVPLGPTGLVLTGVTGGLVFGQKPKTIADASQLTRADIPGVPQTIDPTSLAALVDGAAAQGADLWRRDFTVALSGQIIALEAPGLCDFQVGLVLNTGGQFAGFGTFNTLGIPFADALMLIDLTRTDPKVLARVSSPNAGNPLGFILPSRADFQFTFDAQGLTEGLVFGFRTFLQRALGGTQAVANAFVTRVLDSVAADLQADRGSALAHALLAGNPNATIDRAFLVNRLLALLPAGNLADVQAHLADAGNLVQAILARVLDAAAHVPLDAAFLSAAETQSIQGVLDLIGGGARALGAIIVNLRDAAIAAQSAFEAAFDPFIDIAGSLQPVVLGIPFGPPTAGAHLGITKDGVVFGANLSPSGMLDQYLQSIPVLGQVWSTLKFLDPVPFGLVGSEHLSANVELPLPGSFQTLALGQFPAISPDSGDWLVSVGGELAPFGIRLGSITGAVFNGGNKAAATLFQVAPNYSDAFNPVDPGRIIVSSQERLDLIRQLGGTILNSQVLLPTLLSDPGNAFATLPPLPDNPLDLPGYINDLATILGSYSQLGRVQLFLPSPETLLKFNFTTFTDDNGARPRIAPGDAFLAETPAQQQADLQHLIDSMYLEGVLDAKILGIDLANGRINASAQEFTIAGAIPWLLDLQTSFGVKFAPRPVPASTFVALYGRQPQGPELNADGTANIQFPVVSAQTSINSRTALTTLLQGWGLDPTLYAGVLPAAGATFRAYSPAFDPTSSDPLLRNGGIEFDADLAIPGLLGRAGFKFALSPPSAGRLTPDFVATARGQSLRTISGLSVENALVKITKSGDSLSVFIDGTAVVLGATVHVHGTLNGDLTGTLAVDATTPGGIDVDGFSLQGGLTFTLTRSGGTLNGVLSFNGTVGLPGWLSAASGQATAKASGTLSSKGNFSFQLSIKNFAVGSGTGISIVGATGTGPATFTLAHTTTATTLGIDGGIRFGSATGLPLLAISGSLSSAGAGKLTISFGTGGLNLGGFTLNGGATLNYAPATFSIAVNANLSVPGLFNKATIGGAITQDGISQLSVSAGSLNLGPLTVNGFTVSLVRQGAKGLVYKLHTQAVVDIPDLVTNETIIGDLDSAGFGSLSLTATRVTIFGFTLTGGFAVVRSAAGSSFSATASLTFLGQTLSVATPQPLAIGGTGLQGTLSLTVIGGGRFGFDGWSVGGTLTLEVSPNAASVRVSGGSLSVPGLFTNLAVAGTLNSAGLGSLTVGSPATLIRPGGAISPFSITGTYTLARTQTGNAAAVTTFTATNASFTWAGVVTLTVTTFSVASNGTLAVGVAPVDLSLGGNGGLLFEMGAVTLNAGAAGLNLRLHFGGASLSIPNVATGAGALSVPAFDVDTTGDFAVTLASANRLNFGALRITGKLVFQRVDGVFGLAVVRPTPFASPQLVIPGLANLNLNTFVVNADGTFNVSATTTQFGPDALSVRNATISVKKTGAGLGTFSVSVVAGKLFLPVGSPITLPTLTIQSDGTFSPNNVSVSVPSLDFGPAFSITSTASFNLSLADGVLDFKQSGSVGLSVLAGSASMVLRNFEVASDGTFTGSVTGRLGLLGFQIAQATFNVSLVGGVARLTLPAANAATLDLGFVKVKVSGFVASDGHFSFTGSTTVTASAPGVSASGTATFTLADTGFRGSFSGSFSALGVNLLSASGSITSTGLLTVIVPTGLGNVAVQLQL